MNQLITRHYRLAVATVAVALILAGLGVSVWIAS